MPTINKGKKNQREKTINKQLYQKIYQNKRWKKLRSRKFQTDPLCELCLKEGHVKQAQEIHHIIPFMTGSTPEEVEDLAYNYDNLQSLCIYHHKIVENLLRKSGK